MTTDDVDNNDNGGKDHDGGNGDALTEEKNIVENTAQSILKMYAKNVPLIGNSKQR
jgi:hypothetical protein